MKQIGKIKNRYSKKATIIGENIDIRFNGLFINKLVLCLCKITFRLISVLPLIPSVIILFLLVNKLNPALLIALAVVTLVIGVLSSIKLNDIILSITSTTEMLYKFVEYITNYNNISAYKKDDKVMIHCIDDFGEYRYELEEFLNRLAHIWTFGHYIYIRGYTGNNMADYYICKHWYNIQDTSNKSNNIHIHMNVTNKLLEITIIDKEDTQDAME